MLQLIVYVLLIFLTLLAVCDMIRSCFKTGDTKRIIQWAAPYHMVKNRLRGMKTLKEEVAQDQVQDDKPRTISETV